MGDGSAGSSISSGIADAHFTRRDWTMSNAALVAFGLVGAAVLGGGLYLLARNRRRFFSLPPTDVGRSLGRQDLDVASDYTTELGDDTS